MSLPLEGAFKSRGDASAAIHLTIAERFCKAVALDTKRSGGRKIAFVCPSSLDIINSHDSSTDNIFEELEFDCPRLPHEGKVAYKIRYGHELSFFFIHKNQTGNKTSVCPFHAVAMQNPQDNLWRFIAFPGSHLNFKMHSDECLCLPSIKGKALVSAMKPILAGNNSLSGKEVVNA